jgi:hypothetical protein
VRPARAAAALLLALAAGACDPGRGSADGTGPGGGPIRVTGRLLDAETRCPVSRAHLWVHGFNDDPARPRRAPSKQQRSLAPDRDATTFEFNLVESTIRLRIADRSHEYELFERAFTATNGALDVDVLLVPTHWIRLHGRFLQRDRGKTRPLYGGDGSMGSHPFVDIGPASWIDYDDEGRYSVRVPRELLRVAAVDTSRHPVPREIDLRGVTEDEREQDFVFEE